MGRPRGSKNKRKDPVASGEDTYPSNGGAHPAMHLTEDARNALLITHCVRIEALQAQAKGIKEEIDRQRSRVKNDGFELKAELDHALKRRKDHKSGKLGEILDAELKSARLDRWMNIKPGNEPGLFDDGKATADTAFQDGKIAAAQGYDCKPPDHLKNDGVDSPAQRWISGWHAMRAIMSDAEIPIPLATAMDNAIKADNAQAADDGRDFRPTVLQQREADGVYKPDRGSAIDSLIQGDAQPPTDPIA